MKLLKELMEASQEEMFKSSSDELKNGVFGAESVKALRKHLRQWMKPKTTELIRQHGREFVVSINEPGDKKKIKGHKFPPGVSAQKSKQITTDLGNEMVKVIRKWFKDNGATVRVKNKKPHGSYPKYTLDAQFFLKGNKQRAAGVWAAFGGPYAQSGFNLWKTKS